MLADIFSVFQLLFAQLNLHFVVLKLLFNSQHRLLVNFLSKKFLQQEYHLNFP